MLSISLVLLICALVCFVCEAIGIPTRVNWIGLGLAFITVWFILGGR